MNHPERKGSFIIRDATPADAEQLIAHVHRQVEEPDIDIPIAPGEFNYTVEQEREILEEYAAEENSVYLVAEVDGQIIGSLNCKGGHRRATRHSVMVGLTIRKEWRNKGVGTALMTRAIEWARNTGIVNRIELGVYARNKMAIHLYEKFGFEHEGRLRRALYQNGQYLDDLLMALLL